MNLTATACLTRPASERTYQYSVYGVWVTSDVPFNFPTRGHPAHALAHVEFVHCAEENFLESTHSQNEVSDAWFTCRPLPDGSIYLRWAGLFEFRVDRTGSRVAYRPLDNCDGTVLQNFLFGQALSVALVQQGIEPVHAAVVSVDAGVIGFLGDCTFGKSTLAASFLPFGHRLLTDDLLVIENRAGQPIALPGTGRIKLQPDSARALLGDSGQGAPLNPKTTKRVFELRDDRAQRTGLPLRALFVLPPPEQRDRSRSTEIRPLSRTEVFHELVRNSFHEEINDPSRLKRHFAHASYLASAVKGYGLQYPKGFEHLPTLREALKEIL